MEILVSIGLLLRKVFRTPDFQIPPCPSVSQTGPGLSIIETAEPTGAETQSLKKCRDRRHRSTPLLQVGRPRSPPIAPASSPVSIRRPAAVSWRLAPVSFQVLSLQVRARPPNSRGTYLPRDPGLSLAVFLSLHFLQPPLHTSPRAISCTPAIKGPSSDSDLRDSRVRRYLTNPGTKYLSKSPHVHPIRFSFQVPRAETT